MYVKVNQYKGNFEIEILEFIDEYCFDIICGRFFYFLTRSLGSVLYLPKHNDIFKEGEEDEDDASTHPNIKSRDIADSWCVLPD